MTAPAWARAAAEEIESDLHGLALDKANGHADLVLSAIARIIAAHAPAYGWRPIESAPRDGTQVDLWIKGNGVAYRVPDAWYSGDSWVREHAGERITLPDHPNDKITHWQPLPAPPEAAP